MAVINFSVTLFPPDPTLTVDNVSHIMEKVEPKERQQIMKEVIVENIFDEMCSSGQYSTALELEAAAVDIYVNCCPDASWEHLAGKLYRHHQVAAVEEVRSYLPPRGESGCGVYVATVLGLIMCAWICI